jgi:hypothetical protein
MTHTRYGSLELDHDYSLQIPDSSIFTQNGCYKPSRSAVPPSNGYVIYIFLRRPHLIGTFGGVMISSLYGPIPFDLETLLDDIHCLVCLG